MEQILLNFEEFTKKHPKGDVIKGARDYKVTRSTCHLVKKASLRDRPGWRSGEPASGRCEIEIKDIKYGGLATYEADLPREGTGRVEITDADFPYPDEFAIATKFLKLPMRERRAWCMDMLGVRSCASNGVIGGAFAAEEK